MARNALPTALHDLKGSYEKDPQRRRHNEPQPKMGIGPAPDHFDDYERQCWDEFVGIALPGVLGDSDRWTLELTVKLMAQFRTDDKMPTSKIGQLVSCLSRMGMTPSDRTKLSVPGKKDDGWSDI